MIGCGLLGLTSRAAQAQSVQQWLQETGLSEKEFSELDGGERLVWVPRADDPTEVTLLAAVRIGAEPALTVKPFVPWSATWVSAGKACSAWPLVNRPCSRTSSRRLPCPP